MLPATPLLPAGWTELRELAHGTQGRVVLAEQNGLRGVSFGDSLIKRVVETLKEEFPRLKTFATLSPIPGFRAWLARHLDSPLFERMMQRAEPWNPGDAPVYL